MMGKSSARGGKIKNSSTFGEWTIWISIGNYHKTTINHGGDGGGEATNNNFFMAFLYQLASCSLLLARSWNIGNILAHHQVVYIIYETSDERAS